MSAAAVLLAAGRGERLGSGKPKGFVHLRGRPLLALALDAVRRCPSISGIVVMAPEGFREEARELAGPGAVVVPGGETRQASVRAGLEMVGTSDAVVVHDVARPLASPGLFEAVIAALTDADGAVPAVPLVDTIKRVADGAVAETPSRDDLVAVQTPQGFRTEALRRAHRLAADDGFEGTDDASLLERAGLRVVVVPGDPRNVKITGPEDLVVAAALSA